MFPPTRRISESPDKSDSTKLSGSVWNDFEPSKEKKPKQVFSKVKGNRMVPESVGRGRFYNSLHKPVGESGDILSSESEEFSPESDTSDHWFSRNSEGAARTTDYSDLHKTLGFEFANTALLERALTHSSALKRNERLDYERLEFLGDAVLGLIMAHLLSDAHPDANEGRLSKMRAALVNTQALAEVARELELGPYIKLGRGEDASGGRDRPSILADVTEAVFGAIYREGGFEVAFRTAARVFNERLMQVTPRDPKTDLQEQLHLMGSGPPSYLVELVEGPVHAPTFVAVVMVDGEIAGRGRGATKKAAHQEAATEVLLKSNYSNDVVELAEEQNVILEESMLVFRE